MISHVTITEGYAAKLPAIKGKTFSFTSGLNVCFGPNGCGKSTLLNIMAGYTACKNGGWSSVYCKNGFPVFDRSGNKDVIPDGIEVNHCKARLEWDGTACFFNSATINDAPITSFGMTDMDMADEVAILVAKPSDGQRRMGNLNRLLKQLADKPPDLAEPKRKTDLEVKYSEWVKTLSRTGPHTVILDEPDRCLSIESQAMILAGLPNMATRFQVIIASHNPLLLLREHANVNIIDMEEGYLEHSRKVLDMYVKGKSYADFLAAAQELRKNDPKEEEPKNKRGKKEPKK